MCSCSTDPPTITSPVAPDRPPSNNGSKTFARRECGYGYRRVHVLLRREGWHINQKRTRRIYRELGLQLRNKTPKRRVKAKLREDRRNATRPNETWAMDFVHDQLATGTRLRVLTIVDTFSRFCRQRWSRASPSAALTSSRCWGKSRARDGLPASGSRVDQGTEFVSRDFDLWTSTVALRSTSHGQVSRRTMRSSKPSTVAFRAECLNTHWFLSLADAREKRWRIGQVLQRRTPSWGNRPKDADNAARSRWRSQPGIVSKAEKSNRQRSKDWSHRKRVRRL